MKRFVIGIIVTSIVLYIWGFLYWGLGPYGKMIWKQPNDAVAAGQALREHFPDNGTYFVPAATHHPETAEKLFRAGPVAMVHMIAVGGRPMMDPKIMVGGFFLNVVVIILIALMLHQLAPTLPGYGARVKFVALAGLAAMLLIDVGSSVWWQIDWAWKLYQGFYDWSFFVISGLILAAFVRRPTVASA